MTSITTTNRGLYRLCQIDRYGPTVETIIAVLGRFDLIHIATASFSPALCGVILHTAKLYPTTTVVTSTRDKNHTEKLLQRLGYKPTQRYIPHQLWSKTSDPFVYENCKTGSWTHILEDNLVRRCLQVFPTTTHTELTAAARTLKTHTTILLDLSTTEDRIRG